MQTISLKTNSTEMFVPLLKSALDREKRILTDSLKTTTSKINKLATDLSIDTDKLMKGEVEHTEANDMQLIELEGEIELLRHIKTELKELESVEICG